MERGSNRFDEERDGPDMPSVAMSIKNPELWYQNTGNVQVARLEHGSCGGVGEGGRNVHGRLSRQRSKDSNDTIVLSSNYDEGGHGADLESEEDIQIFED